MPPPLYSREDIDRAVRAAAQEMGYSKLRENQETVVKTFLQCRDVFVSLPTGSGKSLCYCILPLVFDKIKRKETESIAVVVSPLIALMKDQVMGMTRRNVSAVYVGEVEEGSDTFLRICAGKYQIVFMSPEALLTDVKWRDMLQSQVFQENLVVLAVDEAHCVKKWGETFRKEFANLGEVRSIIPPEVKVMALTATATVQTRKAVCKTLGMVNPAVVAESPNKENIKYIVHYNPGTVEETFVPLVEELLRCRSTTDRVIVFCRTYDSCADIYLYLRSRLGREFTEPIGAPDFARFRLVDMFTACTERDIKEHIIDAFSVPDSHLRIVVATVAFGMGLDCPNVRKVIHWGPSGDIELYLQETGRAGRDLLPATAVLYIGGKGMVVRELDESMREYCANKDSCRRQILLKYFDSSFVSSSNTCVCCDVCERKCKCNICT